MTISHIFTTRPGPSCDAQPARGRQAFRQVAEHHADQQRHADAALQHGEAEHEGLRDTIERRAEHDREGTRRLRASASLRSPPPFRSSNQLPTVKAAAPIRVYRPTGRLRRFEGFVDELERDRSDEEAGAERHHDPDELRARFVTYASSAPTSSAELRSHPRRTLRTRRPLRSGHATRAGSPMRQVGVHAGPPLCRGLGTRASLTLTYSDPTSPRPAIASSRSWETRVELPRRSHRVLPHPRRW